MSTSAQTKIKLSGPGLKKEGVVVLQSLFIAFFTGIELLILALVLFGGIRFGRKGTTYVAVVTPPLAFAATVLLYQILSIGLRPSRLGLEFIASLASVAPFLMASALYGWFIYLNEKAKARKPKARA
jgi:TRAP-type C4-dicarboxylate transport system permease large subunit